MLTFLHPCLMPIAGTPTIKFCYLGTPMLAKDYVYMCILVAVLPPDIIEHYNLHPLIHKGHIYIEV